MTQLGYVYESKEKTILLMVTIIYNDKICHIKYLVQKYPCSDTFTTNCKDFRKTDAWESIKSQRPDFIFIEKFNDFE